MSNLYSSNHPTGSNPKPPTPSRKVENFLRLSDEHSAFGEVDRWEFQWIEPSKLEIYIFMTYDIL